MKRCPKCNSDYFDNMLEFCLEDGAKLLFVHGSQGVPPITMPNPAAPTVAQASPLINSPDTLELPRNAEVETLVNRIDKNRLPETVIESQGLKILGIAPVVVALAHNWWQWLYLEKQYVSSITDYIFSANFLMWLLLLSAGATAGFLGLRYSKNKAFAYTGLIVLAINLLLFLVPRR